jgi:hypothetical protein
MNCEWVRDDRVFRKVIGPIVVGSWRKLHNENLCNVYSSLTLFFFLWLYSPLRTLVSLMILPQIILSRAFFHLASTFNNFTYWHYYDIKRKDYKMGRACCTHGEMRNVYTILVAKPERKMILGRNRWKSNIKMNLKKKGCRMWTLTLPNLTYQPEPLPQIKLPLICFLTFLLMLLANGTIFRTNETARKWDWPKVRQHRWKSIFHGAGPYNFSTVIHDCCWVAF